MFERIYQKLNISKHKIHMKNIAYKRYLSLTTIALSLLGCSETLLLNNNEDITFEESKYNNANILRGGKLYDKWWDEKGKSAPSGSNPIWQYTATPDSDVKNNGGQWRCKECHGWDYKGREGAYGDPSSSHYTGVRGLNNTNPNFDAKAAFDFIVNGVVQIENGMPNINAPEAAHAFFADDKLNKTDIYDLTKFIIQFANRDLINSLTGDADRGKAVYSSSSCSSIGCHSSADKKDIIVGIAQTNEAEFLHKVRLGQPGTFMPGGLTNRKAQDVLAFVKAGANTTVIPISTVFDQATYDALGSSDIALGGLMYDKWWDESSATQETTTHQLWPATNTQQSGSSTWRCKACHGWDYRGNDGAYGKAGKNNTGIQGIVDTSNFTMQMKTASNVFSYLELDTTHGFNSKFTTNEYYALTKFIMTMREEANQSKASFNFINDSTLATVNGNATNGKTLYENGTIGCSTCHGADGKLLDFADHTATPDAHEFLQDIALENPWEFIHKVRFGQPASSMNGTIKISTPSSYSTVSTAIDILAYVQTDLTPNIKRAGLLYDKWWKVTDNKSTTPPISRNQTWVNNAGTTDSTIVSNSTTWRCKECHGWDYNGKDGAYSFGTKHYSGIAGLITTKGKTESVIFDAIKSGPTSVLDHDFGQYINDEDITLLAQFILDDTNGIPTASALSSAISSGDATLGKALFEGTSPGNCATCHGLDGKTLPNAVINVLANDNATEFMHKIRFGQPGSAMVPTSSVFQGLSLAQAGDVLAYGLSMSAPATPATYVNADLVRGGRLFDTWWAEMKSNDANVLEPTQENPLWAMGFDPESIPLSKRNTETWRCKSCHAWNYKGIGFFTNGVPSTNGADNLIYKIDLRKNGAFAGNETGLQNYIFDWIKNGDPSVGHKYGGTATTALPSPMTDKEVWDLTKFLLDGSGLIETNERIRDTGGVIAANLTNGKGLFLGSVSSSVNCSDSSCHGIDGTALGPDIFAIAAPFTTANPAGDPWEFLHKIRFGQPGTAMPSLIGNNLSLDDAYDVLGHGQDEFNARSSAQ